METWCCALDFYLVHTFYVPQTLHRHLSLCRMRCGVICHANIDPLLFSCSLLVSLPSGQQTFGNVKKKVDVQSFTSVSPLLIWVVCSSPEAFHLTKVCRDINSPLTPGLHVPEVSSHICCYTYFSVWTHKYLCRTKKLLCKSPPKNWSL